MRENLTKAKLASGEVVYGALINRYAPDQVEIFGVLGYDFVMLDCEHGPMHLDQVEDMVRYNTYSTHTGPFRINYSQIFGPRTPRRNYSACKR